MLAKQLFLFQGTNVAWAGCLSPEETDPRNSGWASPGALGWDKAHQDNCEERQYSRRSSDSDGEEKSLLIDSIDMAQGPV